MNAPALPASFLDRPIAHRGLHDITQGKPENSIAAFTAAIAKGYCIELDLQLSSDGIAMVFHDYSLNRLTAETGPIAQRSAAELSTISLLHGRAERIPTLIQLLEIVGGRVPLLIELKDQDGALGPQVGALERATVAALDGYKGDVALMSFNPHSVAEMARIAPKVPRGLTTCDFCKEDWATIPETRLAELRGLPDIPRTGSSFISHQQDDLHNPRIIALKAAAMPILTWTIRSVEQEQAARTVADNITFEGYSPV